MQVVGFVGLGLGALGLMASRGLGLRGGGGGCLRFSGEPSEFSVRLQGPSPEP